MFVRVVLMSVVAGSAAVLLQAPPSTAGPLCTVESSCVGESGPLPFYAEPLPSLGGRTLSQVLVEHNAKIESELYGGDPIPCAAPAK